jgi:hypothetical protein
MRRSIHQTCARFEDQEGFFSRVLTKLNSLCAATTYPFAGKGGNLSLHDASEISRCLAPRIRPENRVEMGMHAWLTLGMKGNHEPKITIARESVKALGFCSIYKEISEIRGPRWI